MKDDKKVPQLRFPEFTDAWKQRELCSLTKRIQGNDGRMDLDILTISAGNGWMKQEERFSGNIAGKEQKNYTLLHKGELSYNHGNSKLAKYGAVFSLQNFEEALVPRVYHSFKMLSGSAKFIEYYFATKLPDRELGKLISSGARMDGLLNIKYDDFMGIKLTIPSEMEQHKISTFFSKLDNTITLQQRKLNSLQKLKKGLLQKMFPKNGENIPEIRFPEFSDAWKQRKLEQIIDVGSGRDYKHLSEGGIPVYGTGGYMLSVNEALSWEEDAIGIGRKGTIDKPYILQAPFWTVDTLFYAIPKKEQDLDFLYCIFQNIDWKKKDESTGVPSLSKTIINKTYCMTPNYDEQKKIGCFFSKIDNLITLQQRWLFYTHKQS